jgi:hypothetical protein
MTLKRTCSRESAISSRLEASRPLVFANYHSKENTEMSRQFPYVIVRLDTTNLRNLPWRSSNVMEVG